MNPNLRVQVACLLMVAAVLLTAGLYRVHQRHQVIRIGYELSEARTELRHLEEEGNRLRLEESVLTSPERIEKLAAALGMIRPTPNQLKIVPAHPSVAMKQREATNR